MSIATIRSQIKTTLDTVSNVGTTFNYAPYVNDWTAFLDKYKTTIGSTTQIRIWMIDYDTFQAARLGVGVNIREHRFILRGLLGVSDSNTTEITMDNLAEAVCNAMDDDSSLHGLTGLSLPGVNPAQLLVNEERIFGTVLCHYAEVEVFVREERAI